MCYRDLIQVKDWSLSLHGCFFPCQASFLFVLLENHPWVSNWNQNWIPLIQIENWWKILIHFQLSRGGLLYELRLWDLQHSFLPIPNPWLLVRFKPGTNRLMRSFLHSIVSFLYNLLGLHFWILEFPINGILEMFEMQGVILCQVFKSLSQEPETKRKLGKSSIT